MKRRLMKPLLQFNRNRETFLQFRQFSTNHHIFETTKSRKLPNAKKTQRFLDIVSPHPKSQKNDNQSHIRLIDDFLQTNSHKLFQENTDAQHFNPTSLKRDSSISLLFRLHKQGLKIDPCIVSSALSSCGSKTVFCIGTQIHCLVIGNGFMSNIYIGSSLITFYSRWGDLNRAHKVFDEMTARNIVSWSAMINGFAQECDVDMCLYLYRQMRNLTVKANGFTFTSFLIACTGSGCLGQGRSVHCQTIQLGFDSYVHVGNALISMYCKCGEVGGAMYLFRSLNKRDLVSWNSIIAGYAHHGMAIEAIQLFEEMKKRYLVPDSITFLALLSSCRHAGFLDHGRVYFDSMNQYGITPGLDHYSCMVDLLGRAGLIEEARDFIRKMPIRPNAIIWGSLLSSSKLRGFVDIGIEAAANRLLLEPWRSTTHLQLANLYASVGYKAEAAKIRKLMKENGLKTDPGCSWVEIKNTTHLFRAEDRSNICVLHMGDLLVTLIDHMKVVDNWTESFQVEL